MRQKGTVGWLKHDVTNRGVTAWLLFGALLGFYLILYYGGREIAGWHVPDVLESAARLVHLPSKWTLYGLIYTLAVTGGGIYVIQKYRHNRYQIIRTLVVIFVQATFAFSLPWILAIFEQPEYYFSYLWPLKIDYFYPSNILAMPLPFVLYSLLGSLLMVPLLGIFYGKRWYCSWVCGCGGLANTAGEPFRHLTSKTSASWRFEKWSIHITLGLCLFTTALVVASFGVGDRYPQFTQAAVSVQSVYGFVVMSILSGIIGVALYPIGGTRVWCRNFCPMAAMLGLIQKFGRYRIRVKDDMCISCGMCTKYCEMGIDVRAYAQKNQDFVRASCVGCGLCAEVCPRGVLRLENRWHKDPQELTMATLLNEAYKG
ncbi:MAG: 4Fe-4S binding protein [Bradymonadaceae bacterium]|nr:4Fe-4S binding protein [Lujinxingiaceae bacterium]